MTAVVMNTILIVQIAVLVAVLSAHSVSAGLFNHRVGWLKSRPTNTEERGNTASSKCFAIRGGASDKDASDEKVKGLCIGIDLGTTTR